MKMKKLTNLYPRVRSKTALIIIAIVLSSIVTYAEWQSTAEGPGQTAEKYVVSQTQQAAAPGISGTDQKQRMPTEQTAQSANTQKPMKNPGIAVKQGQQVQMKPALPMDQNEASIAQAQTPAIRRGDAEPKTQSTAPAEESAKAGPTTMNGQNNIVYAGILLAGLLAVFLFLQGRKAKNKGSGTKKE